MNIGYALLAAAPGDGWEHMGDGGWSGWMWMVVATGAGAWTRIVVIAAVSHTAVELLKLAQRSR